MGSMNVNFWSISTVRLLRAWSISAYVKYAEFIVVVEFTLDKYGQLLEYSKLLDMFLSENSLQFAVL